MTEKKISILSFEGLLQLPIVGLWNWKWMGWFEFPWDGMMFQNSSLIVQSLFKRINIISCMNEGLYDGIYLFLHHSYRKHERESEDVWRVEGWFFYKALGYRRLTSFNINVVQGWFAIYMYMYLTWTFLIQCMFFFHITFGWEKIRLSYFWQLHYIWQDVSEHNMICFYLDLNPHVWPNFQKM